MSPTDLLRVAIYLGLTNAQITHIRHDYRFEPQQQCFQVLLKFFQSSDRPTQEKVRKLAEAMEEAHRRDLASKVRDLWGTNTGKSQTST